MQQGQNLNKQIFIHMKKFAKSIVKGILLIAMMTGFVCVIGESDDLVTQIIWTSSWIAEIAICSVALTRLFPEDFKGEEEV